MTSTVLTALETLLPAVITLLYAALIGLGVQAAAASHVRFPRSLGITAGIGLSLTALLMVYSYRLFENPTLPIVPLAVLAIIAILWRVMIGMKNSSIEDSSFKRYINIYFKNPITKIDIIAFFIAMLIMSPVLRYGLATWTMGMNDFPNYGASAEIWMTAPLQFLAEHPDAFGLYQIYRASFEKPTVVSLQILMSVLSNVNQYQLLTPMMIFYLFIFLSSVIVLVRRYTRIGYVLLYVSILVATFSITPISRIYDAQPGQIAALALLSTLFAILSVAVHQKQLFGKIALATIGAIVGATTLGSNFTLVVGSSLMLGALLLWGFSRQPAQFLARFSTTIVSGILTIILSIPMIKMYSESFSIQTTGIHGGDIPLASPLAAIGQQISLYSVGSPNQTLLSWGILFTILLALLWVVSHHRFKSRFDFLLIVASAFNAVLIGGRLGWNNYSTHKWWALFIAFVVPIVIAYGISMLRGRGRIAVAMLLFPMVGSSMYFGLRHGLAIPHVYGAELTSLMNNEELSKQNSLNIRLGDMRENSIAALIVPSTEVRITEPTYTAAALPEKGMFLVRRDKFDTEKYSDTINLNDTYAITTEIIALETDSIDFTDKNPDARRFLFGSWHNAEAWGTWSRIKDSHIAFILPESYRSDGLQLTITGNPYAPKGVEQTIEFLVNGEVLPHRHDPNDARKWEIQVPHSFIEAKDGWIAVTIRVGQPLSPSQFGSGDGRTLSFGLSQLKISPLQ